jgi:restriction system protein
VWATRQFETDVGTIDILAQETSSNAFVVIELKKGRESDKVVGQVLRYMGWVSENLCQQSQDVKGIIICKEEDPRLSSALRMVKNVSVKYYQVDFTLQDHR